MDLRIAKYLVLTDKVMDYVPVMSTGSNLIDLFLKNVFIPQLSVEEVASNSYYTHLKEKEDNRCLTLLIPGVGNILILIFDFLKDKSFVIQNLKRGWSILFSLVSKEFQNDREIILATIEGGNPDILGQTTFTDDEEIVLKAVEKCGTTIKNASDRLKNNLKIATASIQSTPEAVIYLSPRLKGNKEIAYAVLESRGDLLPHFNDFIRGDEKLVEIAVKSRGSSLKYAKDSIKNSKNIVIAAIKNDKKAFYDASERLQKDNDVIKAFSS